MDFEGIFAQAEAKVNAQPVNQANTNLTLPRASFGGEAVSHIDVREGAVLIAEGKQGAGFVTLHINLTLEQYNQVIAQLKTDGAEVGDKIPTKNGYGIRRIALQSTKAETEYGF